MITLFCISEKWNDSGHILKLLRTTIKMTCAPQRMYRRMGKNRCIPIKMLGKGKEWIGQTGCNFNIRHKERIIIIWKTTLYEVDPVLTGNHVYEPCWKAKATKYSSRKSHVPKRPENVHMTAVAYRGGALGCSTPPEILKALQNRAKLNPIVTTVKNRWL